MHHRSDCPDASALAGYLDNTLPPHERERLDEHFLLCPRCNRKLSDLTDFLDAWYAEAMRRHMAGEAPPPPGPSVRPAGCRVH